MWHIDPIVALHLPDKLAYVWSFRNFDIRLIELEPGDEEEKCRL